LYGQKEFDEETGSYMSGSTCKNLPTTGSKYRASNMFRALPSEALLDPQSLNTHAYVRNNPVNLVDPSGLWSSVQTLGVVHAVGGGCEVLAGCALALASFGSANPVGVVADVAVAAHGLDQFRTGAQQTSTGEQMDSMTSKGLQYAGMLQTWANIADTSLSIVGSFGAGAWTAGDKVLNRSS
jgi:hypothetical protein